MSRIVPSAFRDLKVSGSGPITKRVYAAIREKITGGHIQCNTQMPSQRSLAMLLGVSRGVVVVAYEQLLTDGFLFTKNGSGTFVNYQFKKRLGKAVSVKPPERLRFFKTHRPTDNKVYNNLLLPGYNHSDLFPTERWKLAERFAKDTVYSSSFGYIDNIRRIQSYVSNRLKTLNRIDCRPDNLLITRGTYPTLAVIGSTLMNTGDNCVVDDPGHPLSSAALRFSGINIIPAANDLDGPFPFHLNPAAIRAVLTSSAVHFPSGRRITPERKQRLLEWAAAHGILVIEDDYEGCLGVYAENDTPYCSFGTHDNVVYVGSFSKFFSYRAQLGFVVAHEETINNLCNVQKFLGLAPDHRDVSIISEFISRGYMDDHITTIRDTMLDRKKTFMHECRLSGTSPWETVLADAGMNFVIPADRVRYADGRNPAHGVLGAKAIRDYTIHKTEAKGMVIGISKITSGNVGFAVEKLSQLLA
jgi:GntR family transcriptional regulator/MocR family aminotransferase